ncbi:unnamed protein product [Didymodactylos carnosus]|uniref:Uncharacterized protein n=1 Tax=Didymodactylos carnosus TaxID=1234261 RepID=A0A8S2F304_9BILA|nr:unnamed protein product [Didymodactylos carnosus]CAF4176625.1 unnamed protein product [Didymodactylos carnosus]
MTDPQRNMREFLIDLFHPTEIVHNADVYSFDHEQFQIDVIYCKEESFDNSLVNLSYSDLCGFVGNIYNKIGLKYSQQGLWMNIHAEEFNHSTSSAELFLSNNVKQIFDFLGYDYQTYINGFDNETDSFAWIKSTKYFKRKYFDDQQKHRNRMLVRKRQIHNDRKTSEDKIQTYIENFKKEQSD